MVTQKKQYGDMLSITLMVDLCIELMDRLNVVSVGGAE